MLILPKKSTYSARKRGSGGVAFSGRALFLVWLRWPILDAYRRCDHRNFCSYRSWHPQSDLIFRCAFQSVIGYLILSGIARNLASGIIDDPSPDKASGNGHEVRYCHSDRIGRRSVGKRAGKRPRRRQSAAALHRASGSFGRAAICADRQLAGQSDPRDHAAERKHLHHDVARPDAVARSAAAARPSVSSVVRSRQSERSAPNFPPRRAVLFLIGANPLH
jgi:hypothetical protein